MGDPRDISAALGAHYAQAFAEHGASSRGVDWGEDTADHDIRLDRMLAVTEMGLRSDAEQSILDVGCGYGALLERMEARGIALSYTGVDICAPMIDAARARRPDATWRVGDILASEDTAAYDFAVCNGIMTQKLTATQRDMDAFAKTLIARLFQSARVGVAFNVMTTHVNFMSDNLYYRNPAELLAWCMSELTPRVRLDHAYPLFEYTVYLYHADAPGLEYGAHRAWGAR